MVTPNAFGFGRSGRSTQGHPAPRGASLSLLFVLVACSALEEHGVPALPASWFGAEGACDDDNPCTDDSGNAGSCLNVPNEAECDDGIACTFSDRCHERTCRGTPRDSACDDANPCTGDICDSLNGCRHPAVDGPCDDGVTCTSGDRCRAGVCAGTASDESCDDDNPCTNDRCDALNGCQHGANTASCDDQADCTSDDRCKNGVCVGNDTCVEGSCNRDLDQCGPCSADEACEDDNPCTTDRCLSGACVSTENDSPCDDGVSCTHEDRCVLGRCVGTPDDAECDDDNSCTRGVCGPGTGCSVAPDDTNTCDDGDGIPCTQAMCRSAECRVVDLCASAPSSCASLSTSCSGENCCASRSVPQGTLAMGRSESGTDAFSTDHIEEAPEHDVVLDAYVLDVFEVTVGRFRSFVSAFSGEPPLAGLGAHPSIPGTGWQPSWDTSLPTSRGALIAGLCNWENEGTTDRRPVTCVTWFEAFAFCVWDGGRLPTEGEWENAAAGGAENRLYPWGSAAPNCTLANMSGCTRDIDDVGSHSGIGPFGHHDLAGNVWEWTLDSFDPLFYRSPEATGPNRVNMTGSGSRAVRGGAYSIGFADTLRATYRRGVLAASRSPDTGFRCARKPE